MSGRVSERTLPDLEEEPRILRTVGGGWLQLTFSRCTYCCVRGKAWLPVRLGAIHWGVLGRGWGCCGEVYEKIDMLLARQSSTLMSPPACLNSRVAASLEYSRKGILLSQRQLAPNLFYLFFGNFISVSVDLTRSNSRHPTPQHYQHVPPPTPPFDQFVLPAHMLSDLVGSF